MDALVRSALPQPLEPEPGIEPARDVEYPGIISLEVDATDVERRIFRARETIPVRPGPMTLLYPQWLPGYHAPQAPIELFAGLTITGGGRVIPWRRHPTRIHAFQIEVPEDCERIEAQFQFLSPTAEDQGRVVATTELLNLEWNTLVLYPAGYFARRLIVQPSLKLPEGWQLACALERAESQGSIQQFVPVSLDELVDCPVFAGRHLRRVELDAGGAVGLNIVADRPDLLKATDEQIAPHRELVRQADRLFGARHFDRYEILLALSDEIGSIGVEHHRSCEAVSIPGYFTYWESTFARRDTIPHEYIHSWNGKYRRGVDSWSPSFDQPIRNSLMWVYEGLTQYLDRVLTARSGLWAREHALQALAETAATHQVREGSRWRPMSDTTRDPIIAARSPLPWPSWQRSEDYYTEGALVWLDVDTRIRELTRDTRSLDDFVRAFFGQEDGVWVTNTYTHEDVVRALAEVAPFAWGDYFEAKLHQPRAGAPLEGLERGGYRLVYRVEPSAYQASKQYVYGTTNLMFSIGFSHSQEGRVAEVLWDGPAFRAGLTAGSQIVSANGRAFSPNELKRAIARTVEGEPIELLVKTGKRLREFRLDWSGGHRFPHLEPITGCRSRLDEILSPLSG